MNKKPKKRTVTKKVAARKKPKPLADKPVVAAVPTEPLKTLILRTCPIDMVAKGSMDGVSWSFLWPRQGPVECADWDPTPRCGGGLHGLAWGEGDWGLLSKDVDAVWMVVEADTADVVHVNSDGSIKVKFPKGNVLFSGSQTDAMIRVMCGAEAMGRAMIAATTWGEKSGDSSTAASSGDYSTAASSGDSSKAASSGDYSTAASSGDYSTAASSGDYSKAASSGDYSTAASSGDSSKAASSGDYSTAASSGDYSTAASSGDSSTAASSGYYSKAASSGNSSTAASSGDYSTAASSGDYSKAASSGNSSTAASSGYYSKAASSGNSGIAASIGNGGQAKAGANGLVIVTYWVEAEQRFRACVGNVGEDGILADTWYKAVNGKADGSMITKVVILSGCSGSGKSTYAKRICREAELADKEANGNGSVFNTSIVSADDHFMVDGEYKFDASKLGEAHARCFRKFIGEIGGVHGLSKCDLVVLDNTNTTEAEIAPYMLAAAAYGAMPEIHVMPWGEDSFRTYADRNVHGVSYETICNQISRIISRRLPPWWKVVEVKP